MKTASILTALVIGCVVLAVGVTSSSWATEQRAAAFTIRSSLDGKAVLPQRIRWIAYPSAGVRYPGVEFLIDGKVVFANRIPPYAFGADGRDEATGKMNTGYVVTSWLSPGRHEFTVRARGLGANRNTTATKTVVARVQPSSAPPAQLVGTWQRELTAPVSPDRNMLFREVTAQPGTYRVVVDRRYIRIFGPAPRKHIKIDYVAGPARIDFRGPVWTGDPNEGAWCEPWGPEASYSWLVSGSTLTLTPSSKTDVCKQRGAIIAGDWKRLR